MKIKIKIKNSLVLIQNIALTKILIPFFCGITIYFYSHHIFSSTLHTKHNLREAKDPLNK